MITDDTINQLEQEIVDYLTNQWNGQPEVIPGEIAQIAHDLRLVIVASGSVGVRAGENQLTDTEVIISVSTYGTLVLEVGAGDHNIGVDLGLHDLGFTYSYETVEQQLGQVGSITLNHNFSNLDPLIDSVTLTTQLHWPGIGPVGSGAFTFMPESYLRCP